MTWACLCQLVLPKGEGSVSYSRSVTLRKHGVTMQRDGQGPETDPGAHDDRCSGVWCRRPTSLLVDPSSPHSFTKVTAHVTINPTHIYPRSEVYLRSSHSSKRIRKTFETKMSDGSKIKATVVSLTFGNATTTTPFHESPYVWVKPGRKRAMLSGGSPSSDQARTNEWSGG